MAKPKKVVKCFVCGQQFDRNLIQAVRHGTNRYSHKTCEPDGVEVPFDPDIIPKRIKKEDSPKQKSDLIILKDYINDYFQGDVDWRITQRQITNVKNSNEEYTFLSMRDTLRFMVEVKKRDYDNPVMMVNSIPYFYKASFNYYNSIQEANQKNKDIILENNIKDEIIKILPPKILKKKKIHFNFLDEED